MVEIFDDLIYLTNSTLLDGKLCMYYFDFFNLEIQKHQI